MEKMGSGKHLVLVHGICHGAWCWFKVVTMLKEAGHRVTPMNLSACGTNAKRLDEVHSIWDYEQPLFDLLTSLPENEKVILVGHSFGGVGISLATEKFPQKVLAAIYLTAFMGNLKFPLGDIVQEFVRRVEAEAMMDLEIHHDNGTENPPTRALFGRQYLAQKVYQKCPVEIIELATMCVRPTKLFIEDLSKPSLLSQEKFGSVDRFYVVCKEDLLLRPDFQKWVIDQNPPKQVKEIGPADHMPMLSTPTELSQFLLEIAEKYK